MASPAAEIRQYPGLAVEGFHDSPYRPPRHPPDVLHKLYVLARQLPPLAALFSFWVQSQWNVRHAITSLTTATFPIRHIFLALLLMFVWNRLFRARKTEGRDTPLLRFLLTQLSAILACTAACTLLVGIAKYDMGPVGLELVPLRGFAVRCGAIGIMCVVSAALSYSVAYRLS